MYFLSCTHTHAVLWLPMMKLCEREDRWEWSQTSLALWHSSGKGKPTLMLIFYQLVRRFETSDLVCLCLRVCHYVCMCVCVSVDVSVVQRDVKKYCFVFSRMTWFFTGAIAKLLGYNTKIKDIHMERNSPLSVLNWVCCLCTGTLKNYLSLSVSFCLTHTHTNTLVQISRPAGKIWAWKWTTATQTCGGQMKKSVLTADILSFILSHHFLFILFILYLCL